MRRFSFGDMAFLGRISYGLTAGTSPLEWLDIGSPAQAGAQTYNTALGRHVVHGGGADMWGTSDQFRFGHKLMNGDAKITVRAESLSGPSAWSRAGICFRDGLGANAPHATLIATKGNGVDLQWRATAGGETLHSTGYPPINPTPIWLQLERSGNLFTARTSSDGVNWVVVAVASVSMPPSVRAGLIVCAVSEVTRADAVFTNFAAEGVIMDPVVESSRIYTTHLMADVMVGVSDTTAQMQLLKDALYNRVWLYMSNYYAPSNEPNFNSAYVGEDKYIAAVNAVMDGCEAVGLKAIPCLFAAQSNLKYLFRELLVRTFNHPAIFKQNGKPVYSFWDYRQSVRDVVIPFAAAYGYPETGYELWVHTRFPATGSGTSHSVVQSDYTTLQNTHPLVKGMFNFAVDYPPYDTNHAAKRTKLIQENAVLTERCRTLGMVSIAGVSSYYHSSPAPHDFGFKLAADVWQAILDLPLAERPNGMVDNTANDVGEISHHGPLLGEANGIVKWPAVNGYAYGPNVRRPTMARSGVQRFLQPWARAFLQNNSVASFPADRLFCWYQLHPVGATVLAKDSTSDIPADIRSDPGVTLDWWQSSQCAYTTRPPHTEWFTSDTIRVAAHLSSPAALRINANVSSVFPAGPAYFEIPLGAFRGAPEFAIVRAGVDVFKSNGPQAIVDSVWPGGWSPLSVELANTGGVTEPAAVGIQYWVSPSGSDSNAGTQGAPFLTLAKARDAVRTATGRTSTGGAPGGGWTGARIWVKGGRYNVSAGELAFDSRDSGTEAAPMEYRAVAGETPVISAGYLVADNAWELITSSEVDSFAWARLPVASQGQVYRLDVGALGIDKGSSDFASGNWFNWLRPLVGNKMPPMARWPDGTKETAGGWTTIHGGSAQAAGSGTSVKVGSATPLGWTWSGEELIVYGHLSHDWTQNKVRVLTLASDSGETRVSFGPRNSNWETLPVAPAEEGPKMVRFQNALALLTKPGTYVWNQARGILYYYPEAGAGAPTGVRLTLGDVALTNGPYYFANSTDAASWLTLKGLTIEGGRYCAVQAHHTVGMKLDGCTIMGGGAIAGVMVRGGSKFHMVNSTLTQLDGNCLKIVGTGDLNNYVDGECLVDGCLFHESGWDAEGGHAAIDCNQDWQSPGACGLIVRNNTVQDLPSVGLQLTGARVLVEGNTIRRISVHGGDIGGIYMGGRTTYRGNIIRSNSIYNLQRHPLIHLAWGAIAGIYLDDAFAGALVELNDVHDCDNGLFHMSGQDTIIRTNVFARCSNGVIGAAIYLGSRIWGSDKLDEDLVQRPVHLEPWLTLFPQLVQMRPGGDRYATRMYPVGSEVYDNYSEDASATFGSNKLATIAPTVVSTHNGTKLNYPIGDNNPSNKVQLSTIWRVE